MCQIFDVTENLENIWELTWCKFLYYMFPGRLCWLVSSVSWPRPALILRSYQSFQRFGSAASYTVTEAAGPPCIWLASWNELVMPGFSIWLNDSEYKERVPQVPFGWLISWKGTWHACRFIKNSICGWVFRFKNKIFSHRSRELLNSCPTHTQWHRSSVR
jgi:hypothetical protein